MRRYGFLSRLSSYSWRWNVCVPYHWTVSLDNIKYQIILEYSYVFTASDPSSCCEWIRVINTELREPLTKNHGIYSNVLFGIQNSQQSLFELVIGSPRTRCQTLHGNYSDHQINMIDWHYLSKLFWTFKSSSACWHGELSCCTFSTYTVSFWSTYWKHGFWLGGRFVWLPRLSHVAIATKSPLQLFGFHWAIVSTVFTGSIYHFCCCCKWQHVSWQAINLTTWLWNRKICHWNINVLAGTITSKQYRLNLSVQLIKMVIQGKFKD